MGQTQPRGFPRSARLLKPVDFKQVFSQSRRYADRYFTVLVHRAERSDGARLGMAISKKQLRRAVDRNRVKRLARESFRRHAPDFRFPTDIVIMARTAAAGGRNTDLRRALEQIWRDAGLTLNSRTS